MNLPPALAPWAPYLCDFPLDVGAALGTLAQRVATLLGPSGQDFDQPEGEVDGYDGLTRRGLPERMLLSDWLLAEEVPDEWARRAAEGELGYLQLARRAPQQSQIVAALFDAGPEVLGAPRLGQLAALLVLSRRAREKGAQLVWGIAQKSTSQVWHDTSSSGAMALLEARGSFPATADDLELWRETLGARDELWLVGGPQLHELALPGESKLVFEDPFETLRASNRSLDVAAFPSGREVRRARLELPEDALCTRLLRDPFGTKAESGAQVRRIKKALAPASNLVWIGPNALAARTGSGGIAVFRTPSSPRGGVAKPKHYQLSGEAARLHFVGEYGGSIIGAALRGQTGVHLHHVGGRAQNLATNFYRMDDDSGGALDELGVLGTLWNFGNIGYQPVLLLPTGDLCRLKPQSGGNSGETGVVEPIAQQVRAAQGFREGLTVLRNSDPARIERLEADSRTETGFGHGVLLYRGEVKAAFRGYSCEFKVEAEGWGVGAYQTPAGWLLHWQKEREGDTRLDSIEIALGETVLGAVGWKFRRSASPALLVRGAGNRGLMLRGVGWNHPLTGDSIESAALSPTHPCVAWLSEGEVAVYSFAQDAVLARWQWGDD